jgi:hypothetical protein
MNMFLHINVSRFEIYFELKIWESRCVFNFRKLIKVVGNGLKIQKFA